MLTLTDARVRALRSRKSAYDIRDAKLRGFGVRVLSSGDKRFFLHIQHRGQRVWHIVGDANAMAVDDARARAASMLAAIRFGTDAQADAPPFESVAEAVFRRYAQVWKPRTLYVNRSYYRCTLAPWFAGQSIADIDRQDVERWFASLRATPVSADRSMPVLSVILTEAERMGHRPEGSNPCRGIRRYRRKGRERFLSDAEIRRLAQTLSAHEGDRPLQVAAVRLILLTGCRKSEVLTLRWSDCREGGLTNGRQDAHAPHRCGHRSPSPRCARVHGVGHPYPRPRGAGAPFRWEELRAPAQDRRPVEAHLARRRRNAKRRCGAPRVPRRHRRGCARRSGEARRAALSRLRRRTLDRRPLPEVQALDTKAGPRRAHEPAPARVRPNAARPHHPRPGARMVRRLQRNRPRRRQPHRATPAPGPQLRRRLRTHRRQSRPRHRAEPAYPLTRFLSREEVYRLDRNAGRSASARQQADIIRLLLLTGCRKNEILALRWAEVHPDALALADSKTGPRKVPLNAKAQAVLARQPRGGSPFVFPSPRDSTRPRTADLTLWDTVRRETGLEDVRLHTLRHTVASHAVMNGVPVPVVSRLLGHSNAQMTLRYAHLADRDIEAAAERIGAQMAQVMALGRRPAPEA